MAPAKSVSLSELSQHTSRESTWFAIDGKVYDVTPFLDEHPGGDEVLKDVAGTDASDAFDDVGHSAEAIKMLDKFLVGNLEGASSSAPKQSSSAKPIRPPTSQETPMWKRLAVPILLVLLVIVYSQFFAN